MTAAELIAKLADFDPSTPVYVRGYEDGIDDVDSVTTVHVRRDVHDEWYYGSHAVFDPDMFDDAAEVEAARAKTSPGVYLRG